jgi:hypothetical protein
VPVKTNTRQRKNLKLQPNGWNEGKDRFYFLQFIKLCKHMRSVGTPATRMQKPISVYVFEWPHFLKERENINDLTCLLKGSGLLWHAWVVFFYLVKFHVCRHFFSNRDLLLLFGLEIFVWRNHGKLPTFIQKLKHIFGVEMQPFFLSSCSLNKLQRQSCLNLPDTVY